MPTIPQEITESTEQLVAGSNAIDQFVHGAATIYIPVRGGTLRPLLYWQGQFQDKVVELAGPYVQQAADSANAAAGSADTATTKAGEASSSASAAAGSASTASAKASQAAGSASTATTKAGEASSSASAAAGSAQTATEQADRAEGFANGLNLPSAAGNARKMLRQAADESGLEYRTPDQVLSDLGLDSLEWLARPIGEPFPLWDHWSDCPIPPTDSPNFRYIRLTAGESGAGGYNEGVLNNETITGSSPTITATGVINHPDSPLNNVGVHLINTSRLFLRPGLSSSMQDSQFESHSHSISSLRSANTELLVGSSSTYRYVGNSIISGTNNAGGEETRPRNVGATYYMRIV